MRGHILLWHSYTAQYMLGLMRDWQANENLHKTQQHKNSMTFTTWFVWKWLLCCRNLNLNRCLIQTSRLFSYMKKWAHICALADFLSMYKVIFKPLSLPYKRWLKCDSVSTVSEKSTEGLCLRRWMDSVTAQELENYEKEILVRVPMWRVKFHWEKKK